MSDLIGIGVYTPAEASRLVSVPAARISRWLNGYNVKGHEYNALWSSQVELGDGRTYLGFRDLMEIRVAAAFIAAGISPQRVRAAIEMAREEIHLDRPLSTSRFKTDGRSIFLTIIERDQDGQESLRLLDTFRRQYAFAEIINPSLSGIEFDENGVPALWRPLGKAGKIVIDPARSFGQPIDEISCVPTAILAVAGTRDGVQTAARAYQVPTSSVERAMAFENQLWGRRAA
jgi:hypothetical protein